MRIKKYIVKHISLILFLSVIELLFYLYEGSGTVNTVLSLLFLLPIIFFSQKYKIYTVLFILPNQRLFPIPGTSVSLLNLILAGIIVSNFSGVYKSTKKIVPVSLFAMAYAVLSALLHSEPILVFHTIKILSIIFVMYYLVTKNVQTPHSLLTSFVLFYVSGVIVSCIIGYLIEAALLESSQNMMARFNGGEFNNPNILGFDISFAISIVMTRLYYEKDNLVLSALAVFTLAFFGLLTQSRSFYFSLTTIMFVFSMSSISLKSAHNFAIAISLAFFTSVILFIFSDKVMTIVSAGVSRIVNPRGGDISGQRFGLWAAIFQYLLNNPTSLMLGIGVTRIAETVGTFSVAHNAILEVIVSWGMIGFSVFLTILGYCYSKVRSLSMQISKRYQAHYMRFLPLLILFLTSMTGHSFLSNSTIIKFVMGAYLIRYYQANKGFIPKGCTQ